MKIVIFLIVVCVGEYWDTFVNVLPKVTRCIKYYILVCFDIIYIINFRVILIYHGVSMIVNYAIKGDVFK